MNIKDFTAYNWKNDYNKFLDELILLKDEKYREFHSGLGINKENLIGIKLPLLKEIAKKISKGNYKEFIKYNNHQYYEEIMLHGLIIGYIKDFDEALKLFNEFIIYIDNWAVCDAVCCNLKIIKKNLAKTYPLVLSYLYDQNPWIKRVGIVVLLSYYVNKEYIDDIIVECSKIELENYYVKMAVAWLISVCYIKFPIITINFLRFNNIDTWTHNKAIQRIRESLRVSNEEKEKLNYLKR